MSMTDVGTPSSSPRRGGGGPSPTGRPFSTPPGNWASTSTRYVAVGAFAAAARSTSEAGPEWRRGPTGSRRPDSTELDYRGRRPLEPGQRLGCAAHILDDVVIDVPAASQVHRQVVRKRAGVDALPVDPVIRLHYVEVDEPDLSSPTGDRERLAAGASSSNGSWPTWSSTPT